MEENLMKKKRPDLEDTQEIIIPREKSDYGDGFDNNDSTNISQTSKHKSSDTLKKDTNFKRNIIIISCIVAAVIILVVGLIVCISLNSSSPINLASFNISQFVYLSLSPNHLPSSSPHYFLTYMTSTALNWSSSLSSCAVPAWDP